MPVSIEELRPHLQAFDFLSLFVEGLGWDHFHGEPLVILVDGYEYALKPVAKKAEFAVFECAPGSDDAIPDYPLRRKIETQVTKRAFEHLIIFVDAARAQQVWQWVKRQAGKPTACREHRFNAGQTGQPLLQRLDSFLFTLEDEAKGIGIGDVTASVAKGFDVERVTKRFYERFRTELTAFGNFIEGITAQSDRDWYASSAAFNQFRWQQTMLGGEVTSADKQALRDRLRSLSDELDRHLAAEYGVDHANPGKHNEAPTNSKDKTKCDRDSSTHDVLPVLARQASALPLVRRILRDHG